MRTRRRPKGLRDKRERHHHALKALAIRENKLHIVGSPEFKIDGTPVYLDVEGLTETEASTIWLGFEPKRATLSFSTAFGLTNGRMKAAFGGHSYRS